MKYLFINSITDISANQWNAIAGVDYPFLRHEFLFALEASGSASKQRGWQPQHLLIEENGQLIAILPLYIKTHSMGEFVFDHSWADAYHRYGIAYYPKLVSAIPFTPATGPRLKHLACNNAILIATVKQALDEKIKQTRASSWHCLFPATDEFALWQAVGGDLRIACQFQWFNRGYNNFDAFLTEFASRKRKTLKKERERIAAAGIRLERLMGNQISAEHWQHFYSFYQLTNVKYNGHTGYLTAEFFAYLHELFRDQLLLVLAYENNEPIAGALNFFSSTTLFGRYWGTIKEMEFLHFETCYYQGIEFCIEQGLQIFDPGVQGEHKLARGFEPVLTHSFHWIEKLEFRPAIQRFLQEEAVLIQRYQQDASTALPFKKSEKH